MERLRTARSHITGLGIPVPGTGNPYEYYLRVVVDNCCVLVHSTVHNTPRPPRSAHQLALHPCNFPGPPLRQCSSQQAANRPVWAAFGWCSICMYIHTYIHTYGYAQPKQTGAAWVAVVRVVREHPRNIIRHPWPSTTTLKNPLAPVVVPGLLGLPAGPFLATHCHPAAGWMSSSPLSACPHALATFGS